MAGKFQKVLAVAGAAAAGWTLLMKPRMENPEELEALKKYDYAHRGYHDGDAGVPENSLAAFKRAVECGFGIELDIHLSKDDHLVVMHDSSLKRMCGEDVRVEDLTWEELQAYHLQETEEKIPDFAQVLEVVDGKIPMVIEVKPVGGNHAQLCEKVCEALEDYEGLYCIESFDPRAVAWVKENKPQIVRGQLLTYLRKHGETSYPAILDFALRNLLTSCWTKPDFIAYHIEERNNVSLKLCRKLYSVCEFDWTVRTPQEYKMVKDDGAFAIFENFDPREVQG